MTEQEIYKKLVDSSSLKIAMMEFGIDVNSFYDFNLGVAALIVSLKLRIDELEKLLKSIEGE